MVQIITGSMKPFSGPVLKKYPDIRPAIMTEGRMYLRFLDGNVSIFLNNEYLSQIPEDNYTGMAEYTSSVSVSDQPSVLSFQGKKMNIFQT